MPTQITCRVCSNAFVSTSDASTSRSGCYAFGSSLRSHRPWTQRHTRLTVFAARKQQKAQETKKKPKRSLSDFLLGRKAKAEPPPPPPEWQILDWKAYNKAWQVPWGRKELFLGLFGWSLSFVAVGIALVPLLGVALGVQDFKSLTSADKSWFALVNQVLETLVGIAVIYATVRRSASTAEPLQDAFDKLDLFKLDTRKPFSKPNGWLFWGLIGVVAAPVVVGTCASIVSAVGYEDLVTDKRGTVDGVAQLLSVDLRTFANLFAVTAILAPLLEETVFRGFLLTTLTKFMPTWAAVLISSLGFGMAHASARDLPQLAALGTLLGFSYVRSRNLLTPMLIHGAWNGTVLSVLFTLASSGVDLSEALSATQNLSEQFMTGHWMLH